MPTYEYYCPTNSKTLEVMHGMSRTVATWGELCELADAKPGETPTDTPVEKLLGTGMLLSDSKAPRFGDGGGGCCMGGGCG